MAKQQSQVATPATVSSPEELDLLMQITGPKSWLALVALGSIIVMVVVWGIIGSIPVEINGPAILLKSGGIRNIVAISDGQLARLYVEAGDVIAEGDLVAEIEVSGEDEPVAVLSPYDGRVLELKIGEGELVTRGAALANLEPAGEDVELEVLMYPSADDAQELEPGMPVRIAPSSTAVEEYGYLLGQVVSVGTFPTTHQGIFNKVGSNELIEAMQIDDVVVEVRIELVGDSDVPSGYAWSSSSGPDFELRNGTLASAIVTVDRETPVRLVLPIR